MSMAKFVMAMEEWQEANRAYHKCCDECEVSADYYCGGYREAMDRATDDMEKAFGEVIVKAVREALSASLTGETK